METILEEVFYVGKRNSPHQVTIFPRKVAHGRARTESTTPSIEMSSDEGQGNEAAEMVTQSRHFGTCLSYSSGSHFWTVPISLQYRAQKTLRRYMSLRVQDEGGGKLHRRLNMTTSWIVNKYCEGRLSFCYQYELLRHANPPKNEIFEA